MEVVVKDVERAERGLWNLDPLWVASAVDIADDIEAGFGFRGSDQLDNDLMADERPAAPVHADKREQTMLDAIPLAGARRVMGDGDRQAGFVRQFLQLDLP
jgi:hypothetical protein